MTTQLTAECWFDLNGARMRIAAADAELMAPLRAYLGPLAAPPEPDAAAFHITLARGLPEEPPDAAHLLYDGRLPEGTPCRISKHGATRWLVVPDGLSASYSTHERRAHMQAAPGAEALIGGSSGILLLDAALLASQQVLVHAAALRLPGREAAVLMLAPSGTGKTTTSLALALQGFGLMADDATVVTTAAPACGTEHRVWGLPRALKVHRRTAELLPAVGRLLGGAWNHEDEQSLSQDALRSIIEVLPPRPVPLAALILLGTRIAGEHRLRPISKAELLALAAGDNIFCSRLGVQEEDLARYHAIARLVSDVPTLQLNVGAPLETLSACVLSALA